MRLFSAFSKVFFAAGLMVAMWGLISLDRSDRRAWVHPAGASGPVRILQFYASTGIVAAGEKARICYSVENAKSVRISPMMQEVYSVSQSLPGNRAGTYHPLHTAGGRLRRRGGHEIVYACRWKPRKPRRRRWSTTPRCRTRAPAPPLLPPPSPAYRATRAATKPRGRLVPPPAGCRVSGRNPGTPAASAMGRDSARR